MGSVILVSDSGLTWPIKISQVKMNWNFDIYDLRYNLDQPRIDTKLSP